MTYKHTTFGESEVLIEFENIYDKSLESKAHIGVTVPNSQYDPHSSIHKLIGYLPIPFNPISIEQAIIAYQEKNYEDLCNYILAALPIAGIFSGLGKIIAINKVFIIKSPTLAKMALKAIEELYDVLKNKNIITRIITQLSEKLISVIKSGANIGGQVYIQNTISNIFSLFMKNYHRDVTVEIAKAANEPPPQEPDLSAL